MTLRHPTLTGRKALVLVIVAALSGCLKFGATQKGEWVDPYADRTPKRSLTAEDLARELRQDPRKSKGDYLEVRGRVDRVRTNGLGDPSVVLVGDPSGLYERVRCVLDPGERDRAAKLIRTQAVQLSGRCEGPGAENEIDMVDCNLKDVGRDPSIRVTAVDLTREYAKDPEAADKKYKGEDKQLEIEGVFIEIRDGNLPVAVLKGDGAVRPLLVAASYLPDQKKSFGRLKRGQTIKVSGECKGLGKDVVDVSSAVLRE